MIRVLRDWNELGAAFLDLQRRALPIHEGIQKNWDHRLLLDVAAPVPRTASVLDLGCGGGFTLRFLRELGFRRLAGMDVHIEWRLRLLGLRRRLRTHSFRAPWRIHRGDITDTRLPPASQDFLVCVSVIEHGVDVPRFLAEAARLLRPGGRLFLTTDYWPVPPPNAPLRVAFGQPWHLFSQPDIDRLIQLAGNLGLEPAEPGPVPPAGSPTIHWQGRDYTALAMVLRRG